MVQAANKLGSSRQTQCPPTLCEGEGVLVLPHPCPRNKAGKQACLSLPASELQSVDRTTNSTQRHSPCSSS